MSVGAFPQIISRITEIERRLDRMSAARLLSPPVASADILDRTITGQDIALGTMQDANFAGSSIHGNKIQTGTLTGTQILDGSIDTADLAGGAVSRMSVASQAGAYSIGGGVWTYGSVAINLTGMTVGSYVYITMRGSVYNSLASQTMYIGIGVDSITAPSAYVVSQDGVAGIMNSMFVDLVFVATATAHSFYGMGLTSGGTMTRYDAWVLSSIELKR
jgi:hypothetical protein